jgi:pre-rRNA-processing protein TSR4
MNLNYLLYAQIYCPAEEPPSGFHRALYLFCCKKRECLQQGSVKCLRTQLPRENPYYCFDPAQLTDKAPSKTNIPLCVLCG